MTTMRGTRQVDLAGAPGDPGASSRFFADTSDYEALAALFGAANQADRSRGSRRPATSSSR